MRYSCTPLAALLAPLLFGAVVCSRLLAQDAPRAEFRPNSLYTIELRRSVAGSDGRKDILSAAASNRIVVETGEPRAMDLPLSITVFADREDPHHAARAAGDSIDWKFTFRLTASGAIEGLQVGGSGGGPQAPLAVLTGLLQDLLFVSVHPLPVTSPRPLRIGARRALSGGVEELTYSVEQPSAADGDGAAGAARAPERTGAATWSATEQWYTRRTETEISTMSTRDAHGEPAGMTMTVTSTWTATRAGR
jgi:hypothetical protein